MTSTMATFAIHLDTRSKNKKNQYNLTIRACIENKSRYINIGVKMTKEQYDHIFVRKSMDTFSIKYREDQNALVSKCERIYSDLKPFDYQRFLDLLRGKGKGAPQTLLVKDLFERYIERKSLKLRTKKHIKASSGSWCSYRKDLNIWNVTTEFLEQYEQEKRNAGMKQSTINSYHRDLRAILNYFSSREKLLPPTYVYPYGKGGFTIKSAFPNKRVLMPAEVEKVINWSSFDNEKQQYARNVWAFLFYCNGINFVDLLRMRWDDRKGDFLEFTRKKTETTRKNRITPVCVPISDELLYFMEAIGDRTSPFILGKLQEGYGENTFENKCHKLAQEINKNLTALSTKIGLSVPLKLKTARESYANWLDNLNVPHTKIAGMMNHSNPQVLSHYLASMRMDETQKVNSVLPKRITPENTPDSGKIGDKQ